MTQAYCALSSMTCTHTLKPNLADISQSYREQLAWSQMSHFGASLCSLILACSAVVLTVLELSTSCQSGRRASSASLPGQLHVN